MDIVDSRIDGGTPFDWGRTSADYARWRDIYPPEFYQMIVGRGVGLAGQTVLDLGTGTGVLPRNLCQHGAHWIGEDISDEQIAQAQRLSRGLGIDYRACAAEDVALPKASLDAVTACQCFWYFDHERLRPNLHRMLRPGGKLLALYMAWLPGEDAIAGASERLVLKYSPDWTGAGETVRPIEVPRCYEDGFKLTYHREFRLDVPFTRESWNGRVRACRAIGASLAPERVAAWEREHRTLLARIAPERFRVRHYAAVAELTRTGA